MLRSLLGADAVRRAARIREGLAKCRAPFTRRHAGASELLVVVSTVSGEDEGGRMTAAVELPSWQPAALADGSHQEPRRAQSLSLSHSS